MSEQKKTEAPKQSAAPELHQMFASFDPMAYWTQSQQGFQKMVADAFGRAQSFAEQYAALETAFVSRAQGAVSNWAQLAQDAIAYSAQLSAEARKLGFETVRKMSASA